MSFHDSIVHFFWALNYISLSIYTNVNLSSHLLKDIITFKFWQLWTKLLSISIFKFLCRHTFSTPLSKFQRSYSKSMFSFVTSHQTVFQSGWTILFSPVVHIFSNSDVFNVLEFGHPNTYLVESRWCFNIHLPSDIQCGTSFHMLICHLYIFLVRCLLRSFDCF